MRWKKSYWSYCLYWRNDWIISGQGKIVKAHVILKEPNTVAKLWIVIVKFSISELTNGCNFIKKNIEAGDGGNLEESFSDKEMVFSRHHFTCLLISHSWGSQWDKRVS